MFAQVNGGKMANKENWKFVLQVEEITDLNADASIYIKGCQSIWARFGESLQRRISYPNDPKQAAYWFEKLDCNVKCINDIKYQVDQSIYADHLRNSREGQPCARASTPASVIRTHLSREVCMCLISICSHYEKNELEMMSGITMSGLVTPNSCIWLYRKGLHQTGSNKRKFIISTSTWLSNQDQNRARAEQIPEHHTGLKTSDLLKMQYFYKPYPWDCYKKKSMSN